MLRLARIATALLRSRGTESIYHTYIKSRNAKRAHENLALRAQEFKFPERQRKRVDFLIYRFADEI